MLWKNGLGKTLEIKCRNDELGQRFRISQAKVIENGYFSDFTGQHRTLVLLSGNGMKLDHKGINARSTSLLKGQLDIAHFSGEDKTYARLIDGPIEDLNIIVRKSDTRAQVTKIDRHQRVSLERSNKCLLKLFLALTPCSLKLLHTTGKNIIDCLAQSSVIFNIDNTVKDKIEFQVNSHGVLIEIFKKH